MIVDINVLIAGSAGEGIQTVGSVLSTMASLCGYGVFSWQEYESRIRGGVNSYSIRVTSDVKNGPREEADIFLPLNDEAYRKYISRLNKGGILITSLDEIPLPERDVIKIQVPFDKLAVEKWKNPIYANSIALGALWSALGGDFQILKKALQDVFQGKKDTIIENNMAAASAGYDFSSRSCKGLCPYHLIPLSKAHYLINGNSALALGAVWGGCRFMAAYPMTPATGIISFLAQHQDKLKVFTEQAEDEIAAVNMALGAQFAGVRAMTATSGGGFALMVETISLSGMVEVPLVIVLAQRPGPATGLPTRTAQGDLLFAIHAGHGEFPKVVLAPSDPLDGFYKMVRAFELADKYQIPVIVMTDQFLADSHFSFEDFPVDKAEVRYFLADPEAFDNYKRYLITERGVSPRLYPGQSLHLVTADSDEHDEEGHITEDLIGTAQPMMEKRMRKLEFLKQEIKPPQSLGAEKAEELFIGWGSTRNAIFEAVDILRQEGRPVGALHFTEVWPLPIDTGLFQKAKKFIVVEQNMTGQFADVLKKAYNLKVDKLILRYDGLPMTSSYIRRHYHG